MLKAPKQAKKQSQEVNRMRLGAVQDIGGVEALKEIPYLVVTEFNDAHFKQFYKDFNTLHADPRVDIIPIVITSFGGQVHTLLAMFDLIESSDKPVATIGTGKAMSCGAFLLAAGTPGFRFCGPNSEVMLHEVSAMEYGKANDIKHGSDNLQAMNKRMFALLGKQCGKSADFFLKRIMERGNADWFFGAAEAKELGLVDHVAMPVLSRIS